MSKNKAQHVIPNCYLKAWCDPQTPPGQTPYIWRFPKDGGEPFKRSPAKSFVSTDRYTIRMPKGERNLILENTLAQLEDKFVRLRARIRQRERLTDVERANLCLFAAAMHARTIRAGNHWQNLQQELHDKIVWMEKDIGAEPVTSLETGRLLENAPQHFLAMSLDVEAPLYFKMKMAVLVTNDPVGFITSDSPCGWYNPRAHTVPPFYRNPGLAQTDIEVTLPITPQHLVLFSHRTYPAYMHVGTESVDQINHRLRAMADQEFVSWKGVSRPEWFIQMPMPADAWENTEEGKSLPPRQPNEPMGEGAS